LVVSIIYKILRRLKRKPGKILRSRLVFVAGFFLSMWIVCALLFYYSEHVLAGRRDIDIWASLYWSIITMATIGYGDIVPTRGVGWLVAGFTAVMGILAYTLTVSVIADAFLQASMKKLLGLAPLRNKKILVIGDDESCYEVIDELRLNGLEDEAGWLTSSQPKRDPGVDYMVGELADEETLRKAGADKAEHLIICSREDSQAIHLTLLLRKINPTAKISAIAKNAETEELLRQAGAHHTLSTRLLGRTIASSVFEPAVLEVIKELTTRRGTADLIEQRITDQQDGKTLAEIEQQLNQQDPKHTYKIIAVKTMQTTIILPPPTRKARRDEKIVLIKAKKTNTLNHHHGRVIVVG